MTNYEDIEDDNFWEVYNCLCRVLTEIIDCHESMRPRHNYHAILNRAELSIAALLDELRGDNDDDEEEE